MCVLQLGLVLGHRRGFATRVGCGEEQWFDQIEVALRHHTVHEHGAHHAAPAHQPDERLLHSRYLFRHVNALQLKNRFAPARLAGEGRDEPELDQPLVMVLVMAATTASPMPRVLTLVVPSDQMSVVRSPDAST